MTRDRLVFFGTDAFSVPALIRLLAEERNVVAVVTKPDSRTGRGQSLTPPAVKVLASAKKIPVLQPTKVGEIEDRLKQLKPDAGIVVAYGKIIPQKVLQIFPKGLFNLHPSLLPSYRGATPIETAILNGDDETGVTLMQLDAGMDTGPTYDMTKVQLVGTETRLELNERLAEIGAQILSDKLTDALSGNIVPIPQARAKASVTHLMQKQDGDLDWSKPAEQLEREIRAYLGWPGSRTTLNGIEVTITQAHVTSVSGQPGTVFKTPSGELAIHSGSGSLVIDLLKPAGKREMTAAQFLTGHPIKA
jgi:methionyl-tRNA formyltransferase